MSRVEAEAPPRSWPRWLRGLLAPALWLERARGRRRMLLVMVYGVAVASVGVLTWRSSRLRGLPDVGEPFDTKPLLTLSVPEERNAFALYKRASEKAKRDEVIEKRIINGSWTWPKNDAQALKYLAANREALELWRQGSERPDALYIPLKDLDIETRIPLVRDHRHFSRLALLEADRLRGEGDLAGAWGWYRAILRGSRLLGRGGATAIQDLVGIAEYGMARGPISAWAADPKTGADLLRQALDDVREVDELSTPCSEALRVEYIVERRMLNNPDRVMKIILEDTWPESLLDRTAWYNHSIPVRRARWFLDHEPERSQRLVRLAFTNWLAHCDRLRRDRPPMVGTKQAPQMFYGAPIAPGAMPAEAVAREVVASLMANTLLPAYAAIVGAFDRDRIQRASLIVELASKLYERERGKPPESPDALIGPYLKRFPEGYEDPAKAADPGPQARRADPIDRLGLIGVPPRPPTQAPNAVVPAYGG